MAISVNQIIREAIQTIKERGLILTPDNYAEVFCDIAKQVLDLGGHGPGAGHGDQCAQERGEAVADESQCGDGGQDDEGEVVRVPPRRIAAGPALLRAAHSVDRKSVV